MSADTNFLCPARMSDGRLFTDYRPRCVANTVNDIGDNGVDSYKYRMYMMNNATEIMKKNMMDAFDCVTCNGNSRPEGHPIPSASYKQVCTANTCSFTPVDPNSGIGLVR